MEQIIDISVPHRGGSRSLQGFSPGHGSGQRPVEQNVVVPVPRRGQREGFSPGHGSGQRPAEQNVDIPVPHTRRPHGGLPRQRAVEQTVDIPVPFGGGLRHGFYTGQSSTAFIEQLVDTGDLQESHPGLGTRARRGARVRGGGAQGFVPGQGSTAARGAQPCVGRQSRRFCGRIWMLPTAGECGFVESDAAKAAFGRALVFPVPASLQGSFCEDAFVTFAVRAGLDGRLEAYHIEAVGGGGVRGLHCGLLVVAALFVVMAAVRAVQVLLVIILLARCFLLSSPGLGCSASWPVWTRSAVMQLVWTFRGVFPFLVVRPWMLGIMAGLDQKDSASRSTEK